MAECSLHGILESLLEQSLRAPCDTDGEHIAGACGSTVLVGGRKEAEKSDTKA